MGGGSLPTGPHNPQLEWGHLSPQDVCPSLENPASQGGHPSNRKGAGAVGQGVSRLVGFQKLCDFV
jgi:hypothetical protein